MKKIAVVTDSNSSMSMNECKELGVFMIPMPFFVNDKEYFEELTLSQKTFFEMLDKNMDVSTSQPSEFSVQEMWRNVLKDYDELIHIPMSSGLSMTCENAKAYASKEEFKDKVFVVDNQRISVTTRQSVIDALDLIALGKSGKEIQEILENDGLNAAIYIMVDTLKYLKKGGRVTPAGAALGTLLHIKPVLQIQGGKLDAFKKAIGVKHAKQIMIDKVKDDINTRFGGDISKCHIAMAYTKDDKVGKEWFKEVKEALPGAIDYILRPLSLSVSCHIGPGAIAITIGSKLII